LRCIAALAATLTNPYSGPFLEDLHLAVTRAGLRFEPILIGGPSEVRSAFATMAKAEAQAVIVMPFFDPQRVILVELAAKHRLAYMSGSRDVTAAGGLVSMAANFPELYERAAFYVDKILKGAKPADLPVEQPTKFQVAINMKTAQALGLTISPTLLARADEVMESGTFCCGAWVRLWRWSQPVDATLYLSERSWSVPMAQGFRRGLTAAERTG